MPYFMRLMTLILTFDALDQFGAEGPAAVRQNV
jgi:hypothetical protein